MTTESTKQASSNLSLEKYMGVLAGIFILCLLAAFGAFGEDMLIFLVFVVLLLGALLAFLNLDRTATIKKAKDFETRIQELQNEAKVSTETHENRANELVTEKEEIENDTRIQTLELERQLSLKEFPLSEHFKPFTEKLQKTGMEDISGITHTQFVELYKTLEETFARNNALPLSRLTEIPDDVRRVNQIETLIDLYGKKMQRVRNDESLDDEDRENKLANWERLMERDISRLEES